MPRRELPESNPAQRLYDVLTAYTAAVDHKGVSSGWRAVWGTALDVEPNRVAIEVGLAFGLIGQVEQALRVTDDEHQLRQFELHHDEWARPFVPHSSGQVQVIHGGEVSAVAMGALGGIASHLRAMLPEGAMPSDESLRDLREQTQKLIDEVVECAALPMEVREVLVRRLHDLQWAMDHVRMMGAEGIRAAVERLAMAYAAAVYDVWPEAGQAKDGEPPEHAVKALTVLRRVKDVTLSTYQALEAPGALVATYAALYPALHHMLPMLSALPGP